MSNFQQEIVDYSTLEVVGEPTVGATRDQYRPPVPPKPTRFATPPESDRINTMSLSRENSLPQPSVPCCECNQSIKTWKCVQCDDFFCDVCWDKQRPHLPHKRGIDGRQHEKVDQEVVDRLTRIFGQRTREEQHRMHSNDINTTWFGVDKEANQPFLHYTNRLVDILQESQLGDSSERFPQLVSFVGQTGAGKSTVIKMLVNRAQAEQPSLRNAGEFPAPVPGLVGDNIPTTGDVHLYADPQTFYNPKPILYADCEGMTGGENTPRGLSSREMIETAKKPGHFMKNKIRKKLAWADNPKKQSREFAVTTMFPRILYTFSDVVVFVLREVRKFETDVLQLLIQWADISIDKSINQPSIPHIVIVVNATDTNIDEAQWDPEKATRGLLDDYKSSVHRVPALIEVLAGLKYRGKHIKTTEQLLEHFYSSVTVVRIPEKGRYMQIDTQVKKLYLLIQQLCASSHECKKRVRMLLNAERLPQYVNSAYDHFSKRLDAPFDFMAEARRHTPLPTDFGGHILNLILLLYNSDVRPALGRAKPLFKRLARPVASCVMLSAIMDNTQGSISSLLRDTYYEPLYSAFTEFCDHWLRCSYQQDGFQCCNARNSHKKGHQEARTGKILSKGDYQPVFDVEEFFPQWIDDIHKNIEYLNGRLQVLGREERSTILSLHQTEIESFYKNTGSASQFKSNLTCLCCVRKIPENVLPCGHVLCNHCIQAFGQDMGQGSFHLDCCPLHPHETAWPTPANIRFKPKEAGVRILSLDGGGVRGIVELVILEALEEALDGHIPIQNFFDLIVGTSTGGIIALGLGAKGWRVSTCMTQFKSLCLKAFTPRGPRAFKALNVVSRKSYYKTRPLEEALQSAFGSESLLYGEPKDGNSSPIRVAVTATLASDNRPAILTNYNTGGDRDTAQYKFVRPADKAAELKIWEAARATAAAPPYFKSFVHSSTLAAYTDGAIHHNCPVLVADNERGLLWEDNINWSPDIVLSLATGKSNAQASAHSKGIWSSDSRSKPSSEARGTAGLSYMWRTANAMLDSQLNCNNIWNKYKAKVTPLGAAKRIEDKQRYLRIDIPFNRPRPALDDVKQLDDMERHARNYIKGRPEIREAAQRLIASCFYFEKSGQDKGAGSFGCIFGNIRCRLREGSRDLKGLGKILRSYILGDNFVPFFYLQENFGTSDQRDHELPIGAEIIGKMCDLGLFKLPTSLRIDSVNQSGLSNICLRLQPRESHRDYHYDPNRGYLEFFPPLSGFPRELFASEGPLSPLIKEPDLEGEAEDVLPEIQDAPTGPSRTYSETGSPRQDGKVQRFLSLRTKPSSLYKSLSYLNMRGKAAAPGESSIRERHSMDAPLYGVPRLASSSISTLSTRDSRYSYETTDRSIETEDIYNDDHF